MAKQAGEKTTEVKEILKVDATTPVEAVLAHDAAGGALYFEYAVDRFLKLDDTVARELSHEAAQSYHMARSLNIQAMTEREQKPSGITVSPPQNARAAARLQWRPNDPNWHKDWHDYWAGAFEIDQRMGDGYKVVSPEEGKAFVAPVGGCFRVGANGKDELILLKIPKAEYDARQRGNDEKRLQMLKAPVDEAREKVERAGLKPIEVEPEEGDEPAGVRTEAISRTQEA